MWHAPGGRRRVRTKQGSVCFLSLGIRTSISGPMFWSLRPASMIEREACRIPTLNADEWTVKKELFDAKVVALTLNTPEIEHRKEED